MLGIVKEVCADFNWSQNVQLSSSQKFDLTREHLGSVGKVWDEAASGKGETMGKGTLKSVFVVSVKCAFL